MVYQPKITTKLKTIIFFFICQHLPKRSTIWFCCKPHILHENEIATKNMKNERKSFMERSFGAWLSEFIDWMLTLKSFFPFSAAASLSFSFLKPAGTKRRVMTQKKLVSRECWWWKDFVELVVASNAQFSTEESLLCWASDSCECNSLCNIHQLYRLTLLEFLIDVKNVKSH